MTVDLQEYDYIKDLQSSQGGNQLVLNDLKGLVLASIAPRRTMAHYEEISKSIETG